MNFYTAPAQAPLRGRSSRDDDVRLYPQLGPTEPTRGSVSGGGVTEGQGDLVHEGLDPLAVISASWSYVHQGDGAGSAGKRTPRASCR
jgi:hypothetical protein